MTNPIPTRGAEPLNVADNSSNVDADALLRIEALRKHFGGVYAVAGVSLSIRAGEVHALVGENGAGKSTLIKTLFGIHQPDEGAIYADGKRVAFRSPHDAEAAGVALVPQELDLFDEMSIAENLYVGRPRPRRRWGGIDWGRMQKEARNQFARLGVDLDVTQPMTSLSAANQQIAAIARALMRDAKVIILDEPTASLSDRESDRLLSIIRALRDEQVGVLYVSHRLKEIFAISDRVTIMRDGQHVDTVATAELTMDRIVELMVGRPLSELYVRHPSEPGPTVLEVSELTSASRSFEDISLSVKAGEIVGLAGLVGAGRTELAEAIYGVGRIVGGRVAIDGQEVRIATPVQAMSLGIGLVPEERKSQGLVLDETLPFNVSLGVLRRLSRLGFVSRAKVADLAQRSIKTLGVRGTTRGAVRNLSGGNQQKVVIAKAIAREPKLLILDEPTRGVDVGAKAEIYKLIDELSGKGLAVLMISSEMEEILAISDRIIVMHEGRITGELDARTATQRDVMALATGTADHGSSV